MRHAQITLAYNHILKLQYPLNENCLQPGVICQAPIKEYQEKVYLLCLEYDYSLQKKQGCAEYNTILCLVVRL